DVMGDSYEDVWVKLKALEAVAAGKGVSRGNTHLEGTLTWVDGVFTERGKKTAIHTHRVFFHKADNPQSEWEEGIRRVDKYIEKQALVDFAKNGRAERVLGKLDEVILVFDTRGHDQIKEHLKEKEKEVNEKYGARYKFMYLDEMVEQPDTRQELVTDLNTLVEKYRGKELEKIIEGVIYSRYVGVLLELQAVEKYFNAGSEILQSGRESFDADGKYLTELDIVVRDPRTGKVYIVECKSARTALPEDEILEDKVEYKLRAYKAHRTELEKSVGYPIDGVIFCMDVGRNEQFKPFLEGHAARLEEDYGYPVKFDFIESGPATVSRPETYGRKKGAAAKKQSRAVTPGIAGFRKEADALILQYRDQVDMSEIITRVHQGSGLLGTLGELRAIDHLFTDGYKVILAGKKVGGVTELDFAAEKDGILFLGETKGVNPDSPYGSGWLDYETFKNRLNHKMHKYVHNRRAIEKQIARYYTTGKYDKVMYVFEISADPSAEETLRKYAVRYVKELPRDFPGKEIPEVEFLYVGGETQIQKTPAEFVAGVVSGAEAIQGAIGIGSSLDKAKDVERRALTQREKNLLREKIIDIEIAVAKARESQRLSSDEYSRSLRVLETLKQYFARGDISVFDALVEGKEDYLLAFASGDQICLSKDFFSRRDFRNYLDELLFHEGYA
ncbi:MAG TPA: hypothetical protein VJC03_07420, partial [bacterium]|nr:hypothetical protein [bacterium]